MDKHCSGSDSDSSGEYVYDNPFLLEDDKFEREFETTLALFDALLIGEGDIFIACYLLVFITLINLTLKIILHAFQIL